MATSTQDHTSAHAQDGDAEAAAGQKFIAPLVTPRNLISHIPETPNPMIRAITAARMRMTVVMLFGEKRKDNITTQPTSFHTLRLRCSLQSHRQEGRSKWVSHRPRARWTSEAHDHSRVTNIRVSTRHQRQGTTWHGDTETRVLPLEGGSGPPWRMLLSAPPGA